MVKGHGKSSASSATRIKHQKKTAVSLGIDLAATASAKTQSGSHKNKEKTARGKNEGKKEPKFKACIFPVKPTRAQPDPLEAGGLASRLPPEMVVVLRNVGKKAQVTKIKALEDLKTNWVEKILRGNIGTGEGNGVDTDVLSSLVDMIPAWIHYIPPLFVHPSRRVRQLAISVHLNLLKVPEVRAQVLYYLQEVATSETLESVLGTWCVLAHDIDKLASSMGTEAWNSFVRYCPGHPVEEPLLDTSAEAYFLLDATSRHTLFGFLQRTALDPPGVYAYLNPLPTSIAPTPPEQLNLKNRRPGGSNKGTTASKRQQLASAISAARKAGIDAEEPTRSKSEEYDENESDRSARLRISAVGGLRYFLDNDNISEEVMMLLKNPLFWSLLYYAEKAPFLRMDARKDLDGIESLGHGQPNVRQAGWGLLMKLLDSHKEHITPILPVLSSAVLRSAWVEPDTSVQGAMWQPLLTFIKGFPNCWEMELNRSYYKDEDGDEEDTDSAENSKNYGAKDQESNEKHERPPETIEPSLAYQDFLQFLQLGCSGSPVEGYPTVVITLSTIPSSIIASSGVEAPLENLFDSLWAALDGRALSSLHRFSVSAAFLSALLECVVFMARRLILDTKKSEDRKVSVLIPSNSMNAGEDARSWVYEQFGKVWQELKGGRLKVEERTAARLVAQNLDALDKVEHDFAGGKGDTSGLRYAAWKAVESGLRSVIRTNPVLASAFLKVLFDHFKKATTAKQAVEDLVFTTLNESVQRVIDSLSMENGQPNQEDIKILECMLGQFREALFDNWTSAQRFDELVQTRTDILFETSPSFLFSYLAHRKHEESVLGLWYSILDVIVANVHDKERTRKLAVEIMQAVQKGDLPRYLKPKSNELDDVVGCLLGRVLSGEPVPDTDLDVVKAIMKAHFYFLSEAGYATLVETIATTVALRVELLIGGTKQEDLDLAVFRGLIDLLDVVSSQATGGEKRVIENILPNVFLFGHLIPDCVVYEFDADSHVFSVAKEIWRRETDLQKVEQEVVIRIFASVKLRLSELLIDTQVQPLPREILRVLPALSQAQEHKISILDDIFPSSKTLDNMLRRLPHDPINPSIAAIDPLIPTNACSPAHGPQFTDNRGFSTYARIVEALLRVFLKDRKLAKQNLWALRHFIVLSIFASDYQMVPAETCPVFESKALTELGNLVSRVQQITAYLILGSLQDAQDGWRRGVMKRVGAVNHISHGTQLEDFVVGVLDTAAESDEILDTRVLGAVLGAILEDIGKEEAEQWVGFAWKLERTAPQTSMTIISAIAKTKIESLRLDRYRNEQANKLSDIKPTRANTDGLLCLRRLVASAPDLESDVIFLSQNRAVNVVITCQNWAVSDDVEINEEVDEAMMLIFVLLVPILLSIPGSHWEFIWDMVEGYLESSYIEDDSMLTTLIRSIRLVVVIEDLVKANKPFKSEWDSWRTSILEKIRDLAFVKSESISPSLPRSNCRELILNALRELPDSLMNETTLPRMCHLVIDHSIEVQKVAYGIMRSAAKKRTEHLVIEAGVDIESTAQATLPLELLDIVQRHVDVVSVEDKEEQQNIFGSLLAWMLIFDLFQDASFKVKSEYIEQLGNAELINNSFIPLFLGLLRLEGGLDKAFKVNIWAVNIFYVDFFELGNPISIRLLAAHLYYRALLSVPALVHSWLSNCKDRQLSSTLTTYTSQYFSPTIIDVELAHIKGPAGQELADDNMSIKVAAAVNEVMASYSVDEHQLEIKLKIPPDWPLHKIEVRDLKRVGVDNERWRAWILAVQQIIWSSNGRITDGLSLFKKNVALYFEGQVECAICYSIISVMDSSLPKKTCQTCKNKYHAGCLYKWFHTSNASTCPLCRSQIILA